MSCCMFFNCNILWGDDVRSLIPSVLCPCVGSERAVARKEPLETLHKSRNLQNKNEQSRAILDVQENRSNTS